MSWGWVNWDILNSIKYNWMYCFISNGNVMLIIDMNYMSCVVWFNNFFNFLENSLISLWYNIQWNISYISNFNSIDSSFNFCCNYFWFIYLIWVRSLYWNKYFILNLYWLYRFVFQRNIVSTIDFNNWILN